MFDGGDALDCDRGRAPALASLFHVGGDDAPECERGRVTTFSPSPVTAAAVADDEAVDDADKDENDEGGGGDVLECERGLPAAISLSPRAVALRLLASGGAGDTQRVAVVD